MKLIEKCIDTIQNQGIADLHLTANNLPYARHNNGEMYTFADSRITTADLEELADEIGLRTPLAPFFTEGALSENTRSDFTGSLNGCHLRVNASVTADNAISFVMRVVPDEIPSLGSLRLRPQDVDALKAIVRDKTGLVLVTGATGSGKSTTLAALVDYINESFARHIILIEDPREFVHVNKKSKITPYALGQGAVTSFSKALRAVVRQDPDVIMVGEIRDADTMSAALAASDTGHLVLGTLHTRSAAQTIQRVESFYPAAEQAWARAVLSNNLLAVVAQDLLPCAKGGRVLAYEFMRVNAAVRTSISDGRSAGIPGVLDTGYAKDGQLPYDKCLQRLASEGLITDEVLTSNVKVASSIQRERSEPREATHA